MSTTREKPLREHSRSEVNDSGDTESRARATSCCEETVGPESAPMGGCPMVGMCKGMTRNGAWSGWLLLLPGAFLFAFGLLVVLVPEVLAWLLGSLAILMGFLFLVMGNRMRRSIAEPGHAS